MRPGTPPASSWTLVSLLTLVGVLNYFDRELPFILAESIKRDLSLSDTQLGLINGFGFLLIYAAVGLPISRIADRGRHGLVLAVCIGTWSVMTSLGGMAANGWQLALARMGVAVGEAGSTPTAHAVIAHHFPPGRRGMPLGILSTAAAIGAMLGLIFGGYLNDAIGWRGTFILMGIPGLLIGALVLWKVPNPRMTGVQPGQPGSMLAGCAQLLATRGFVALILAAGTMAVGTAGQVAFTPAFLMRTHGLSSSLIGLHYGLSKGALGIGGLVLAGVLIDRLSLRDVRWVLWLPAIAVTVALPCSVMAWHVEDATLAIALASITNAVGLFYLAPVFTAAQLLAPAHLRAMASAMALFSISVVSGVGPLAIGLVSDALNDSRGASALNAAMLLVPMMHLAGAALFVMAAGRFRQSIATRSVANNEG